MIVAELLQGLRQAAFGLLERLRRQLLGARRDIVEIKGLSRTGAKQGGEAEPGHAGATKQAQVGPPGVPSVGRNHRERSAVGKRRGILRDSR